MRGLIGKPTNWHMSTEPPHTKEEVLSKRRRSEVAQLSVVSTIEPYQKQRKQNLLARLFALKLVGRSTPNYNINALIKASLKENPLRLIKNFLGMLKRI